MPSESRMFNRLFSAFWVFFLCSSILSCDGRDQIDPSTMAESVAKGIGEVRIVKKGKTGAPVIIFEEWHGSRLGNHEQALALVRLHESYQLRDIALEGYLMEESEGRRTEKISESNKDSKFEIALQLLYSGEVNSAEFMSLAFDVNVHSIERGADYSHVSVEAQLAPFNYTIAVAQRKFADKAESGAVSTSELQKFSRLSNAFESASEQTSRERLDEVVAFLMSYDAWAKEHYYRLRERNNGDVSLESQIALLDEILDHAKKGTDVEARTERGLRTFKEFLKARRNADATMADLTASIADAPVPVVAMIVGAGHTAGISEIFTSEERPFAVIRTGSAGDTNRAGRLSREQYERKRKGLPVEESSLDVLLVEAFSTQIKPKPVFNKDWLKAKSETYLFIDRLTKAVLAGGGAPPVPPDLPGAKVGVAGEPPELLRLLLPDDYRGQYVAIDIERVEIVVDSGKNDTKTLLFPIVMHPNESTKRREFWVKAGLDSRITRMEVGKVASGESREIRVKESLERLLGEVKESSGKRGSGQGKGRQGRASELVRITRDTKIRIAENRTDLVKESVLTQ